MLVICVVQSRPDVTGFFAPRILIFRKSIRLIPIFDHQRIRPLRGDLNPFVSFDDHVGFGLLSVRHPSIPLWSPIAHCTGITLSRRRTVS